MKKVKLIFGVSMMVLLAGCSRKNNTDTISENEPAAANPLEGTWKITKAEGQMADLNIGTKYVFEGEKLTLKGGGISTPGTYTLSGDTILYDIKGFTEPFKYLHRFESGKLILTMVNSDQVFYFTKE